MLMSQGITCEITFLEQVSTFNPQHKFKVVILYNNSDRLTFLTERKKHLYREWVSGNNHPKITILNSRLISIVISQYGIVYGEMNCFRLTISLLCLCPSWLVRGIVLNGKIHQNFGSNAYYLFESLYLMLHCEQVLAFLSLMVGLVTLLASSL